MRNVSIIASKSLGSHCSPSFRTLTISIKENNGSSSLNDSATRREYWDSNDSVRRFLAEFAKKNGIERPEDWYGVSFALLNDSSGGYLKQYRGSLGKVLPEVFPEITWYPWLFEHVPRGYWSDISHQRFYMTWLGAKLNRKVDDPDQWYSITQADFVQNSGTRLILLYKNSPFRLLSSLFPHMEWLPWKFDSAPRSLWSDRTMHRKFLDWLGAKLGYTTPDGWYQVNQRLIVDNGGKVLVNLYGSFQTLIIAVYSEHKLLPWLFSSTPDGFWLIEKNRNSYLDWLKGKLNKPSLDNIKSRDLIDNNGIGLLKHFKGSLDALYSSMGSSRPVKPLNQYASIDDQREAANRIAANLGFDPADEERWYSVTLADLARHGMRSLVVNKHKSSIFHFLKSVYPDIQWKPWRFTRVSKSALSDTGAFSHVVDFVVKELKIQNIDDWRRVTKSQLSTLKVKTFFDHNGGIEALFPILSSHSLNPTQAIQN